MVALKTFFYSCTQNNPLTDRQNIHDDSSPHGPIHPTLRAPPSRVAASSGRLKKIGSANKKVASWKNELGIRCGLLYIIGPEKKTQIARSPRLGSGLFFEPTYKSGRWARNGARGRAFAETWPISLACLQNVKKGVQAGFASAPHDKERS